MARHAVRCTSLVDGQLLRQGCNSGCDLSRAWTCANDSHTLALDIQAFVPV